MSKKVFVANRADDDWFENQSRSMQVHYFNITYTAGRRKKTDDGFAAKKSKRNPTLQDRQGIDGVDSHISGTAHAETPL